MTVLGRGLIFQPVLASLPYTQTCTYNSDTIITLQNLLTVQIFGQNNFFNPPPKKKKDNNNNNNNNKTHDTSKCFEMALKLSTLHVKKKTKD